MYNYNEVKIPKYRSKNQIVHNDSQAIKIVANESIGSINLEDKPEENIKNMMYQRALEESIEGFENILKKIEKAAML